VSFADRRFTRFDSHVDSNAQFLQQIHGACIHESPAKAVICGCRSKGLSVRTHCLLDAFVHPILIPVVGNPDSLIWLPSPSMRMQSYGVTMVEKHVQLWPVLLNDVGRRAVALGDLGIHPDRPSKMNGSTCLQLQLGAQRLRTFKEILEPAPRRGLFRREHVSVGLDINVEHDGNTAIWDATFLRASPSFPWTAIRQSHQKSVHRPTARNAQLSRLT
jgi:hypothetical protein